METVIKSMVQNIIPNSKVLLFGSRAKKTNKPDSDYDILIIAPFPLNENEKKTYRKNVRLQLAKLCLGFDIIVQGNDEIEIKRQMPGNIVREALKDAVEL